MRAVRVALLTEIPAPYRLPLFNELGACPTVDPMVLFLSTADPKRPYELRPDEMVFGYHVLAGRSVVRGSRWLMLNRGVTSALRRLQPEVVIVGGWNQPAFWLARRYASRHRVPLVAWVESTARDTRPNSGLFERAKRTMIASCAAFLVPGRASLEYLVSLGVPESRIAIAPNAVDLSVFRDGVATARVERDALRARLDLTRATALYVGRLDPEKGVDVLLNAMRDQDADLVVIGDGTQNDELRRAAPANVRFTGWLLRDELVQWFAASDVFVLPSRSEQWGMVLNEAAAAGLPIVASTAAGAAWDLIEDGVSGTRFEPGDVGALREALRPYLSDRAMRERAGRASAALSAGHTASAWATAVAELAQRLTSTHELSKSRS